METEKPIIDVDELLINQGNKEYKIQFIANESYNQNEMILKVFQNNSKENYNPKTSVYKIITALPDYIIINEDLKIFFSRFDERKIFSIDCLISIFEIFEALNWEEIKKYILIDYKLENQRLFHLDTI